MNGVDYTKALAKDREYFNEANKKIRDDAQRRIDENEKHTKAKLGKQRDRFIQDKAEIEQTLDKRLKAVQDHVKKTHQLRNEKFTKDLESERQKFAEATLSQRQDFNQKLNQIKSSYDSSLNTEKTLHQNQSEINRNKFENQLEEVQKSYDSKIADYLDSSNNKSTKMNLLRRDEVTQLMDAHREKELETQKINEENLKYLRKRHGVTKKSLTASHAADLNELRKYSDKRLKHLNENMQTSIEKIANNYEERNEKNVQKNERLEAKKNYQHREEVANLRRKHDTELRKIKLDQRREGDKQRKEYIEFRKNQEGIKSDVSIKKKIQEYNDELMEAKKRFVEKSEADHSRFNESFKVQAIEANAEKQRQIDALKSEKLLDFQKNREKAAFVIENVQNQRTMDQYTFDTTLTTEKNNANNQITRLKEHFNTTIKSLEDRHAHDLETITRSSNQDKNDFIKSLEKRRSDELYEIKRAFSKVMDTTVQDYEKRISSYQRENEQLKVMMDQKVQKILEQTEDQLKSQRTIFSDRRESDIKNMKIMMDEKEYALKQNINDLNEKYQKKIDRMQLENDEKMKVLSKTYESTIKNLKEANKKEMLQKDSLNRLEMKRITDASRRELDRVVSMYEEQIENMKDIHGKQVEKLKENNNLA